MDQHEEIMEKLHTLLGERLFQEISKKGCKASIFAVAARFLKDNNWTAPPEKNTGVRKLGELIRDRQYPFSPDGDVREEDLEKDDDTEQRTEVA